MKRIIVATVTTALLCSGSLAYAQQQATTPTATQQQQPPAAAANGAPTQTLPQAPPQSNIDPRSLTQKQRDYIVNTMLDQKTSMNAAIPSTQQQFKDAYAKMPQSQQLALVGQMLSEIQAMPPKMRDAIMANMPQ